MAILVTRPQPDNETTAAALRAKGFEVLLAPMLRFEPVAFHDDADARYGAVIVTSANALRAIAPISPAAGLLTLPLFAVGERTAEAARHAGFGDVAVADGNAAALRDLIAASARAKTLKKASTLLYLAGADLAGDLAGELGERGFNVVTHTTYRMVPVVSLPQEASTPSPPTGSRRCCIIPGVARGPSWTRCAPPASKSPALAIPQCCISDAVASIVRDVGATQVLVARSPDENGLFEALDRALAALSR